jgi:hypothetical protein
MSSNEHIITTKLYGGLGNQLFQIAIAYANSLKYNTQFFLREPANFFCGQGSHPFTYKDSIYQKIKFIPNDIPVTHTFKEYIWCHLYNFNEIQSIMTRGSQQIIEFDGHYQTDKHFYEYSSEIRKLFTPDEGIITFLEKNSDVFSHFPELKESSNNRCFIGVRRGDYVERWNVHNPCGMTYFNKAMNMMDSDSKKIYYISSDDYTWARKHFVGDNFKFLDIGTDVIQLYIGCLFNNYIISNSSFHWWISFLSIQQPVRVIAPDKWITIGSHVHTFGCNVYRDDMEIIERPVEP